MIDTNIFLIVFFGYFVSFVFYFVNFELQKEALFEWGKKTASAALFAHFLFLLALFSQRELLPSATLWEYGVPFLVLALSYFMEWRHQARFLMLFSLPIVLLLSLFAVLHSHPEPSHARVVENAWLWLHLGFILTGLAGLGTAVSSAVMYLLQSSQLKSKQPGKIFLKLPSLDILDRIHFRSLVWGVVLFSLGIVSGFFWAQRRSELAQVFRDPKILLSFLACALYWVILSLRLSALRRGQKIALGTVLVFVLLFGTVLSSATTSPVFHKGF